MRRIGITFVLVMAVNTVAALSVAQTVQKPQFEVASVKPNNSGCQFSSTNTNNGLLRAKNITLRQLILQSFRLLDFQLVGGPSLSDMCRFICRSYGLGADGGLELRH
jgi:hypothetical protein